MWSVTEERVEQLLRQMRDKKEEHDALERKSIHQLWSEDLDAFVAELDKVWEQEEIDRLKHGAVKNEGKRKRRAPAKKPAATLQGKAAAADENEPPRPKPRK